MKCNESGRVFELESPYPYPATITITPRAPTKSRYALFNIYIYIYIYYTHTSFIKHRHFLSTYFLLDSFAFPYCFYRNRRELIYELSIVVYIPCSFCRIQKKIFRQKMSIMLNEICINEEMLPKYRYFKLHDPAAHKYNSTLEYRRDLGKRQITLCKNYINILP